MPSLENKNVAVLTSDIVHSTKMSPDDYASVMRALQSLLEHQQQRYKFKFEIFRGDSFQILYPDYSTAMQSTISIRLYLQSGMRCPAIKLTQSLALGNAQALSESIGSSIGEAFIVSGRELDKASRGDFVLNFSEGFYKSPGESDVSTDLSLSTIFLRQLLGGLTEKQSEVLFYYIDLNYPEQQSIADIMKMTRQNVATHLKRSGSELVKAYLTTYHQLCLGQSA